VVYQDLIALLVAASQSQTQKLDEQSARIENQSAEIAELKDAQASQSKQMSDLLAAQAKQMSELLAKVQRMEQARRGQEEERVHLVTGVANATELANETDQNVTNTTDIENATGDLNFTNATSANISDKTTQTRLRKP